MPFEFMPVRPKERQPFHCQLCGRCCKGVEQAIMLEPLDIYHLCRHFRDCGDQIDSIEKLLAEYAQPTMITDVVPIFTLKAVGQEKSCVFLKDNRCSVYDARPRVCRLYPFAVKPGERGREFLYYLSKDKLHHFTGGSVSVKDWFYQNFPKDERAFVKADYEAATFYGKEIKRMGGAQFQNMLFPFLFYRYYNYDLNQPFLPQFLENHEALKRLMESQHSAEQPDQNE